MKVQGKQIHLQVVVLHNVLRMVGADFRAMFADMKHIPRKLPIAWISIIAIHDDVTVEFANSTFCERVLFDNSSENTKACMLVAEFAVSNARIFD